MCPSGKSIEEHTQETRDIENRIKDILGEIENNIETKCS